MGEGGHLNGETSVKGPLRLKMLNLKKRSTKKGIHTEDKEPTQGRLGEGEECC